MLEARLGSDGIRDLDLLLGEAEVEPIPVDAKQALAACEAFRRFGTGRHAAGLNLGDCFAYALARVLDEPLLFKGSELFLNPS